VDCQDFENGGASISIELYEMEDVTAAYGIFTFLRNSGAKPLEGIGNLGQQQNSLVLFMQNSYYVMLRSEARAQSVQPVLLKMAGVISRALPKAFQLPPIVNRFPRKTWRREVSFLSWLQRPESETASRKQRHLRPANGAEGVMASINSLRMPPNSSSFIIQHSNWQRSI
jgi:hypothetical protein